MSASGERVGRGRSGSLAKLVTQGSKAGVQAASPDAAPADARLRPSARSMDLASRRDKPGKHLNS